MRVTGPARRSKRTQDRAVYQWWLWSAESRRRWRCAILPGPESDTAHVLVLQLQLAQWRLYPSVAEQLDRKRRHVFWRFRWTKLHDAEWQATDRRDHDHGRLSLSFYQR